MAAVAAYFDRGTHGRVGFEGEAETVAVAIEGTGITLAHRHRDLAVKLAALGPIHRHQLGIAAIGDTDLARVDAVGRVERPLDPLQLFPQLAKEGGAVLGAKALAVLAPHQAAIFGGKGHHLIGDAPQQHLLFGIAQIERRSYVQHTGIDVAKHAVVKAVGIKQGAKLHDEIGQRLWRHGGIFGEGHRLLAPFGVAKQPHRLLAHGVDGLDARQVVTHLIADNPGFAISQQRVDTAAELYHLGLVFCLVGIGKLDNIEPLQILAGHILNKLFDRMPDDVGAGQPEHPGVHGFHRQRLGLNHKGGVAQGRGEAVVLDVNQGAIARNGCDVESGFGDKAERPFRSAQHPAHIQRVGIRLIEVLEIVAGQKAVELGEGRLDVGAALLADAIEGAIDLPFPILQRQLVGKSLTGQRLGGHQVAVLQHGFESQYVIRGFAVDQRPLPRSIGVDHAA